MDLHCTSERKKSASRSEGETRAKILRRCQKTVARASGSANKVFNALSSYIDFDGYCWPLVSRLQNDTNLSRNGLFLALSELESIGVIDRRVLISRVNGRNAPTLYRIGGKVQKLPDNARRYILAHKRKTKARTRGRTNEVGDVPKTGTSQTGGDVPKSGTRVVPKTGTQKLIIEVERLPSGLESEGGSGVAVNRSDGKPTPKVFPLYQPRNSKPKPKPILVDSRGVRLANQGGDDD